MIYCFSCFTFAFSYLPTNDKGSKKRVKTRTMAQDNYTELTEVNEKGKGMKNWNIDRIASRVIGIAIMLAGVAYFFFGTFQQDEIRFVAFAACLAIGMGIMKDDRSDK